MRFNYTISLLLFLCVGLFVRLAIGQADALYIMLGAMMLAFPIGIIWDIHASFFKKPDIPDDQLPY